MFHADKCHLLSATKDQYLNQDMGTMDIEEFVSDWRMDANTPEQLDALAFQMLCCARRATSTERGRPWKDAWRLFTQEAADARARLARHPSRDTHPGFYDRSAGRPGHLDSDLYLPMVFELDLSGMTVREVFAGSYEPTLRENEIYQVVSSRDGYTWLRGSLPVAIKIRNRTLRGLMQLGRLVAKPLSALPKAA